MESTGLYVEKYTQGPIKSSYTWISNCVGTVLNKCPLRPIPYVNSKIYNSKIILA